MKNKILFLFMALMLVTSLVIAGCAGPAPAPAKPEPTVFKAISYVTESSARDFGLFWLIDRVNARSGGELIIEYIGGPEVCSVMEQPEAVISGIYDLCLIPASKYETMVPGMLVLHCVKEKLYGTARFEEERKPGGLYDYMREIHEQVGLYWLGRGQAQSPMYIMTTKKVEKQADFAELKLAGTSATHCRFVAALGAAPVQTKTADLYTAVQTGLVDGMVYQPSIGLKYSHQEVIKYIIKPPYKTYTNTSYIMNPDSWNNLPKHLQDLMTEAMVMVEYHLETGDLGLDARALTEYEMAGVETIHLSKADTEWYTSLYHLDALAQLEKNLSLEEFSRVKEIAAK